MGAFTALLNSEKAVIGGLLTIAATVLTALGHMTVADWTTYTQWIFGIYVVGKTLQGGSTVIASAIAAKPVAPAAPIAAPNMTNVTVEGGKP
jgi:hypothetical protein